MSGHAPKEDDVSSRPGLPSCSCSRGADLRDEATPSAGTPPQVGPTSGSKVVVSGEDAEVLLNED